MKFDNNCNIRFSIYTTDMLINTKHYIYLTRLTKDVRTIIQKMIP